MHAVCEASDPRGVKADELPRELHPPSIGWMLCARPWRSRRRRPSPSTWRRSMATQGGPGAGWLPAARSGEGERGMGPDGHQPQHRQAAQSSAGGNLRRGPPLGAAQPRGCERRAEPPSRSRRRVCCGCGNARHTPWEGSGETGAPWRMERELWGENPPIHRFALVSLARSPKGSPDAVQPWS